MNPRTQYWVGAMCAFVFLMEKPVQAANYTWNGGGGASNGWSYQVDGIYTNWVGGQTVLPGAGDVFTIGGGYTSVVDVSCTVSNGVVGPAGQTAKLIIPAGVQLTSSPGAASIAFEVGSGAAATGRVEVSGVYWRVGYRTTIGSGNGSWGSMTIKSGGLLYSSNHIYIAMQGTSGAGAYGELNLENGATCLVSVANANVKIGGQDSTINQGILDLRGGTFVTRNVNSANCRLLLGLTTNLNSTGIIRGYGEFVKDPASLTLPKYSFGVELYQGRIIADGDGENRDLNLSAVQYSNFVNSPDNTTNSGCYAIEKGRLLMPWSPVINTSSNYVFCENTEGSVDLDPDLVNSVVWSNITPSAVCSNQGALLALDRDGLLLPSPANMVVSLWEFTPSAAITSVGKMIFRYDHLRAKALNLVEADMALLMNSGSGWKRVPSYSVDTVKKQVIATGLGMPAGTNQFAIGKYGNPGTLLTFH